MEERKKWFPLVSVRCLLLCKYWALVVIFHSEYVNAKVQLKRQTTTVSRTSFVLRAVLLSDGAQILCHMTQLQSKARGGQGSQTEIRQELESAMRQDKQFSEWINLKYLKRTGSNFDKLFSLSNSEPDNKVFPALTLDIGSPQTAVLRAILIDGAQMAGEFRNPTSIVNSKHRWWIAKTV